MGDSDLSGSGETLVSIFRVYELWTKRKVMTIGQDIAFLLKLLGVLVSAGNNWRQRRLFHLSSVLVVALPLAPFCNQSNSAITTWFSFVYVPNLILSVACQGITFNVSTSEPRLPVFDRVSCCHQHHDRNIQGLGITDMLRFYQLAAEYCIVWLIFLSAIDWTLLEYIWLYSTTDLRIICYHTEHYTPVAVSAIRPPQWRRIDLPWCLLTEIHVQSFLDNLYTRILYGRKSVHLTTNNVYLDDNVKLTVLGILF